MSEEVIEHRSGDHVHETAESRASNRIVELVYFVAGIIAVLLGIRLLLILFGARNVGIVNTIYDLTNPLITPFYGIFGRTPVLDGARLEIESVLALIAVLFLSYIIAGLARLLR